MIVKPRTVVELLLQMLKSHEKRSALPNPTLLHYIYCSNMKKIILIAFAVSGIFIQASAQNTTQQVVTPLTTGIAQVDSAMLAYRDFHVALKSAKDAHDEAQIDAYVEKIKAWEAEAHVYIAQMNAQQQQAYNQFFSALTEAYGPVEEEESH